MFFEREIYKELKETYWIEQGWCRAQALRLCCCFDLSSLPSPPYNNTDSLQIYSAPLNLSLSLSLNIAMSKLLTR